MGGKLSTASVKPVTSDPADINDENLTTPARNEISKQISDPRSVTAGIIRTPLIVWKTDDETPTRSKPYVVRVSGEEGGDTNEVRKKLSGLTLNPLENTDTFNTPERTSRLLDPRSITAGINRTPLILSKMENDTPVKGIQYGDEAVVYDVGCDSEESLTQSETENNDEDHVPVEINESLTTELDDAPTVDVRDKESKVKDNVETDFDSEIINIEGKIVNSSSINKLKMTSLIYEDVSPPPPTLKSTPVKPKSGRTPLGLVSRNASPLPSPLGLKPWRGFHEERIRLGLENTPPGSEPFIETIQSAPGKVNARRAAKKVSTNLFN